MQYSQYYSYLEANLPAFFEANGINWNHQRGIIVAHGDKGDGYKCRWESAGIPFAHAMCIYLLGYCQPFSSEVRETRNGWVDPCQWVIDNAHRFIHQLPPIPEEV